MMAKNYFPILSFRKRLSRSLSITLISALFICLGYGAGALADINVGDILVADDSTGINGTGVIFIIDPVTGQRTVLTDFGRGNQGPLGEDPRDLVMEPNGNIFVIDSGQLFHVDMTNGTRTVISDFGDPAQGPLGDRPQGLGLFTNGDLYVADLDAPDGDGGLFRVDKITGFRTLVTDLANAAQGPTGQRCRAVAEGPGGIIYLLTSGGGTDFKGILFQVDPVTGFRTEISDMGNMALGPTASPRWLAVPVAGNLAYVVNPAVGVGNNALFSVNTLTGDRQIISDFTNPAQGPTETNVQGIAIDGSGQVLVNGNNSDVLFRINRFTGFRTIVTNYDDPQQGGIGGFGQGIIVATGTTPVTAMKIPTLSELGLIAMAGILGIVGFIMVRRRRKITA